MIFLQIIFLNYKFISHICKNKKGISRYLVLIIIAVLFVIIVLLLINQQQKEEDNSVLINDDKVSILPLDNETNKSPFIQLSDQSIADGVVAVNNLYTTLPSWLVIHSDENGVPGEVLGNLALSPGLFSNLSIPLSNDILAPQFYGLSFMLMKEKLVNLNFSME